MNTERATRFTHLALGVPIVVAAAFGVPATAQADTPPSSSQPLPGGIFCAFEVTMTTLTDDRETKTLPNGDQLTTGHYVVQFAADGKSQTFNVSGARRTSVNSTGTTETDVFTGPSYFLLGPKGQRNTGAPGISYAPGRTVVQVDLTGPNAVVTSISHTAPVTDICELLQP